MDEKQEKLNQETEQKSVPSIKTKKKRSRTMTIVLDLMIILLFITGIFFLLEPEYLHWRQDQMTDDLMRAYEAGDATILIDPNAYAVPGEEPEINETYETVSTDTAAATDTTTDATTTIGPTPTPLPAVIVVKAIGRIQIPAIDLNMPIAEGATTYNLRVSIGHYIYSAAIGEPGLSIFLGHRMYTYGRHFNRLGEVVIGNQIIIENKSFRYTYEVDQIDTVLPTDLAVEFSAQYEESRIMLVTCTPVRVASHRLLVKAKLIATENLG